MIASLHTPTLALAIAIVQLSLSCILLFFLVTRKPYPGVVKLTTCQLFWCAGYLLFFARAAWPEWLSITIANYLIMIGIAMVYEGLAEYVGKPLKGRARTALHLGIAALMLVHSWHTYIEPDMGIRVVVINLFRMVTAIMCVWLVVQHRHVFRYRSLLPILILFFAAGIATAFVRAYFALLETQVSELHADPIFRLHMLTDLVLFILIAFIALILNNIRSEQELDEARQHAEHASRIDSLTGLWNRLHFDTVGRVEEARARRFNLPLSVMIFDIDHFKSVNDQRGHLIGDEVIRGVAAVARNTLRSDDMIFRWGGEEFVVLMQAESHACAIAAEKIRVALNEAVISSWGTVTVSVGVAQMHVGSDLTECLKRADASLYRAKKAGRNRVVIDDSPVLAT